MTFKQKVLKKKYNFYKDMKKKNPKTKKKHPLERIAIALESIAQSLASKPIPETKSDYWTIIDRSSEKTSEIVAKARSLFSVYLYDEKNLDKQFPAPQKDVIASFRKSIEPDEEHRNKSYNDFMSENKSYMTTRQYLLLCIHVWETERKHLDIVGWTRTSSLWSDGYLVRGGWGEDDSKLCLDDGGCDYGNADGGPREQISL